MSVNKDYEIKNVDRSEFIEILIRDNGCTEEDATVQASLSSSKGLIIKGVRYVISGDDK